jgi:hypothetical protein
VAVAVVMVVVERLREGWKGRQKRKENEGDEER